MSQGNLLKEIIVRVGKVESNSDPGRDGICCQSNNPVVWRNAARQRKELGRNKRSVNKAVATENGATRSNESAIGDTVAELSHSERLWGKQERGDA